MRRPLENYSRAFGITPGHWEVFRRVAGREIDGKGPWIILVRGGKERCIPWIERGFPAKPAVFDKIKVDPTLGLLRAVDDFQRKIVWAAGHYLLDGSPSSFKVRTSEFDSKPIESLVPRNLKGDCHFKIWQQQGLVLDHSSCLPFTSDYDIAAIIDTTGPRQWGQVHLSVPRSEKDLPSPFNNAVLKTLNELMEKGTCRQGEKRIQHTTQAQYASGSPMNKDDDVVLVFHPDGKIEQFVCATVAEGREELKNLLREVFPPTAGQEMGKVIPGPWKRKG